MRTCAGDMATAGAQDAANSNACKPCIQDAAPSNEEQPAFAGSTDMEPPTQQGNTGEAQNTSKAVEGSEQESDRHSAETVTNSNPNESDQVGDARSDKQDHEEEEEEGGGKGSQAEKQTDNEGDGEEDNAELAAFLDGTAGAQSSLGLAGLAPSVNPVSGYVFK